MPRQPVRPYFKITLYYVLFGFLWIFISDRSLFLFEEDPGRLSLIQSLKGCLYVLLSAVLILWITKRAFDREVEEERKREQVFTSMLGVSNHILRNYVNQMQVVMQEAEKCADFDRETLKMANEISGEVEAQLNELAKVEDLSEAGIDAVALAPRAEADTARSS